MRFWNKQKKVFAAVVITAFAAGCGREEVPSEQTSGSPSIETNNGPSTTAAKGSREQDAEFRYAAREMYGSLFERSCEAPPGFSRDRMLNDERRAVSEFERSLNGRPGSEHTKIAKADAALEGRCSMDSEPDVALTHVNMTKEDVRLGLERMREMAPLLRSLTLPSGLGSGGGELRRGFRRLIESIQSYCPIVTGVPNDQVLAPARERVAQFERGLSGSELVAQFDIAEADVEFELSITRFTCLPPEIRELEIAKQSSLRDVEQMISELEAIIGR